jgi:hypothetical protein
MEFSFSMTADKGRSFSLEVERGANNSLMSYEMLCRAWRTDGFFRTTHNHEGLPEQDGVVQTGFIWRALVDTVMNLWVI